ncbi:MAG: 1-deoxy-D-xylulose-5-phosphate synthase, partial [Gammaproteobacteria bacterium]
GRGPGVLPDSSLEKLPWGRGELLREGKRVALLGFGSLVSLCEAVGEVLDGSVANMRFIKPLDEALVRELAGTHELLVTVEENAVMGGAGSAVAEVLSDAGICVPLLQFGLLDRYIDQGTQSQQLEEAGLDRESLLSRIRQRLEDL